MNYPYKSLIAYLSEVENKVDHHIGRIGQEADKKAQEIMVTIKKLQNTFDEVKKLTEFPIVDAEITVLEDQLSLFPYKQAHLLCTAQQIYARFKHIIKYAATWDEPLPGLSANERDLFNWLVFKDLYRSQESKVYTTDPQNMENYDIDYEKS